MASETLTLELRDGADTVLDSLALELSATRTGCRRLSGG